MLFSSNGPSEIIKKCQIKMKIRCARLRKARRSIAAVCFKLGKAKLIKIKDLLAVFTFQPEQHPFPADGACLRHPILGGKPAAREIERD